MTTTDVTTSPGRTRSTEELKALVALSLIHI